METLLTIEQITQIVSDQQIIHKYLCGDGTLCAMFTRRCDVNLIKTQSVIPGSPKRTWWIWFDELNNKFVLKCSYFDINDNPITYEEFVSQLLQLYTEEHVYKIPAVLYTQDTVIEWVSTAENEWTATYQNPTPTSGCMIVGALSKIIKAPENNTNLGEKCIENNLYDVTYIGTGQYNNVKLCDDFYVCGGTKMVCE
jgi:hypothetical protein